MVKCIAERHAATVRRTGVTGASGQGHARCMNGPTTPRSLPVM